MLHRALVLLAIVAACFAPDDNRGTSPATLGTTDASTTTGACPDGTLGCSCYGNGTCDEGLACDASTQICTMPGCSPGAPGCACVEGVCLEGLDCVDGTCVDQGATSATDSTGGGTGATGSTAASDTTGCANNPFCADCYECVGEVMGPNGACENPVCNMDQECVSRVDCCAEFVGMCAGCCQETTVDSQLWADVSGCIEQACPACRSFQCN